MNQSFQKILTIGKNTRTVMRKSREAICRSQQFEDSELLSQELEADAARSVRMEGLSSVVSSCK